MNRVSRLLLLILEQKDYQPASFFSQKLNVSSKTIYNLLKQIETEVDLKSCSFDKVPRKGIRIVGSETDKQLLLAHLKLGLEDNEVVYSLRFRRLFFLSELFFRKEKFTYNYYAEKFFVSQQSIKKDFDHLIEFLQSEGLVVKHEKTGLLIQGDELLVQQAFKNYLEDYQNQTALTEEQTELIFDHETQQIVSNFVSRVAENLNSYSLQSLTYALLIAFNRIKIGKHFPKINKLVFEKIELMQFYMTVLDLSNEINSHLGINLDEEDVYYLCILLLGHGVGPVHQMSPDNHVLQQEISHLISMVSQAIDCDLSKDGYLAQSLMAHIVPMIYRLKIGVKIKNPIKDDILTQYGTMFVLVSYCVRSLERLFNISLTDDELSFMTIHFQLAFEKIQKLKYILVICPQGMGTSQLIYQRIKQSVPENAVLETISLDELSQVDLSRIDLIVSAVEIDSVGLPVVYVSALPTNKEIAEINSLLSLLESSEKSFIPENKKGKSLLKANLNEEFIYLKKDCHSMEEVIDFVSKEYETKGIVTKEFREFIYNREKSGTTALSTGVAIPHADPSTVLKSQIGIVTLAEPVLWGETKVEVVLVLAITEDDVNNAKEIVASIYNLLTDETLLKEITRSKTEQELIQKMLI